MEAETYLSSGFGIRVAIEGRARGWSPLGSLAKIWMPGRLKGIQVSPAYGAPFLAATQVFDARPVPRKWIALQRTGDAASRFVSDGAVLVTRSGSVGRATLAYAAHEKTLISDDLLRVESLEPRNAGWVYAFLKAPQTRAMATSQKYGHIIKHLEVPHLESLPIPAVDDGTARDFSEKLRQIVDLRNEGYRLTLEAEALFERTVGPMTVEDWGESGFTVTVRRLAAKRRRLDASVHNPGAGAIRRHLAREDRTFSSIVDAGYEVWLPTRFRRIPAEDGVWFVDSGDLTEVNLDLTKRIADGDFGDPHRGRVEAGWILMARSGQTYGIIGTAILATEIFEDKVISDHVMRIRPGPNAEILPGYLVTALTHPVFGRPLVKSLAYGSSIPEIDPMDLAQHEVVRLGEEAETEIDELAKRSAKARASADGVERELTSRASEIIEKFIAG